MAGSIVSPAFLGAGAFGNGPVNMVFAFFQINGILVQGNRLL
jgi:hypothetical protein